MRGTFKGIEVKRRGGVQAHRRVGSLKLLQDLQINNKLSDPPPLRFLFPSSRILHTDDFSAYGVLLFMRPIERGCNSADGRATPC